MTTSSGEAVHTVTYFEVAPATAAEVAQELKGWIATAAKAGGISGIEAFQRSGPGHHFALVAGWASRKHYDGARDGAAGTALREKIGPHLICGIDTRIHNALIGGGDGRRGSASVIVVTHVDVPPPNKDACISLLETHVKASRCESGCARFDVYQQADRPNHFSVVEGWASEAAYSAHIVTAHTREFRFALTPLSGALYDERLYKAVG